MPWALLRTAICPFLLVSLDLAGTFPRLPLRRNGPASGRAPAGSLAAMTAERATARPRQRADELEREADRLERHGEEVEERIEPTRANWERKR